jgi:hypothetical protein
MDYSKKNIVARFGTVSTREDNPYDGFSAQLPTGSDGKIDFSYSKPGTCGSPYFALLGNCPFIPGLHRGKTGSGDIIAEAILYGQITDAQKRLVARYSFLPPIIGMDPISKGEVCGMPVKSVMKRHPKNFANFMESSGTVVDLGVVEGSHTLRNPIIVSPLNEIAEAIKPADMEIFEPAVMSKRAFGNKARAMDVPNPLMDMDVCNQCVKEYTERITRLVPSGTHSPLTVREDIEKLIDWSTSAGLGFDKAKWKVAQAEGCDRTIPDKYWDQSMVKIERLKNGETMDAVFSASLKVELRKVGKDARVFMPSNFVDLICLYHMYAKILQVVKESPFAFCLAIGLDLQGPDGDNLYEHLNQFDNYNMKSARTHATDYKGWDETLVYQVKLMVMEVINQVIDHCFDVDDETLNMYQTAKGDLSQFKAVIRESLLSIIMGLPSGFLLTSLLGGMSNVLLKMYCYYMSAQREMDSFFRNVAVICMGDDSLSQIRDGIDFPATQCSAVLAKLGMTLTGSDKRAVTPYVYPDKGDFLNRLPVFLMLLMRVVWAVSPTSICKALQAVEPSKTVSLDDQLYSTIQSILVLSWAHGEKVHEHIRERFRKWLLGRNIEPPQIVKNTWKETLSCETPGWRKENPGIPTSTPWKWYPGEDFFARMYRTIFEEAEILSTNEDIERLMSDGGTTAMFSRSDDTGMSNFNERMILLKSYSINDGDNFNVVINPLLEYLSHPMIKERIKPNRDVAGDMLIRISSTSPKTSYGGLYVCYHPMAPLEVRPYSRHNLHTDMLLPGSVIPLGKGEYSVEMTCTMVFPKASYNGATGDFERAGHLKISTMSPMDSVFPKNNPAELRVYGSCPNMRCSQNTLWEEGDEGDEGVKMSDVTERISSTAAAIGAMSPFPALATLMGITAGAADKAGSALRLVGFSRPRQMGGIPRNGFLHHLGNLASTDAPDETLTLGCQEKRDGNLDPRIAGGDGSDELSIEGLSAKPFLISVINIPRDKKSGDAIFQMCINPGIVIDTPGGAFIPPVAIGAFPHKYWSGDAVITARVFCAEQQALRMQIVHDPTGPFFSMDTHKARSAIWDIRQAEEFQFEIPYSQERPMLAVRQGERVLKGSTYNPNYDNGAATILINSPFTTPGDTDAVRLVIYMHWKNVKYMFPMGTICTRILNALRKDPDSDKFIDGAVTPGSSEPYALPFPTDPDPPSPEMTEIYALGAAFIHGKNVPFGGNANNRTIFAQLPANGIARLPSVRDPFRESNWVGFRYTTRSGGSILVQSIINKNIPPGTNQVVLMRSDAYFENRDDEFQRIEFKWLPSDGVTRLDIHEIFVHKRPGYEPQAFSMLGEGVSGCNYVELPQDRDLLSMTVGGTFNAWTGLSMGGLPLTNPPTVRKFEIYNDKDVECSIIHSRRLNINGDIQDSSQDAVLRGNSYVHRMSGDGILSMSNDAIGFAGMFAICYFAPVKGTYIVEPGARRVKAETERPSVFVHENIRQGNRLFVADTVNEYQETREMWGFIEAVKEKMEQNTKVEFLAVEEVQFGTNVFSQDDIFRHCSGEKIESLRPLLKRYGKGETFSTLKSVRYYSRSVSPRWNTIPTMDEWVSGCFIGMRGGMRLKVVHQSSNHMLSHHLAPDPGFCGAIQQNLGSLASEFPYYSPDLFTHARGSSLSDTHLRAYCAEEHGVEVRAVFCAMADDFTVFNFVGMPLIVEPFG